MFQGISPKQMAKHMVQPCTSIESDPGQISHWVFGKAMLPQIFIQKVTFPEFKRITIHHTSSYYIKIIQYHRQFDTFCIIFMYGIRNLSDFGVKNVKIPQDLTEITRPRPGRQLPPMVSAAFSAFSRPIGRTPPAVANASPSVAVVDTSATFLQSHAQIETYLVGGDWNMTLIFQ